MTPPEKPDSSTIEDGMEKPLDGNAITALLYVWDKNPEARFFVKDDQTGEECSLTRDTKHDEIQVRVGKNRFAVLGWPDRFSLTAESLELYRTLSLRQELKTAQPVTRDNGVRDFTKSMRDSESDEMIEELLEKLTSILEGERIFMGDGKRSIVVFSTKDIVEEWQRMICSAGFQFEDFLYHGKHMSGIQGWKVGNLLRMALQTAGHSKYVQQIQRTDTRKDGPHAILFNIGLVGIISSLIILNRKLAEESECR